MEILINGAANFECETHHTDALGHLRMIALQQREHFDLGFPAPLRFKRAALHPVTGMYMGYEREETSAEAASRRREETDRRLEAIDAAIAAKRVFIAEARKLGMSVASLLERAQEARDARIHFHASIVD